MKAISPEQFDGCVRLLMQSSNEGGRVLLGEIEDFHGAEAAERVRKEARARFDKERSVRDAAYLVAPKQGRPSGRAR